MSNRPTYFLVLLAALSAGGCGGKPPETSSPAPVALVEIQPASVRNMSETLRTYGTTEFVAADAATLAVQVELQVAELLVTSGTEVKRGQALMRLAPSQSTRLELGKARRDAALAAAERDRMQRLRSEGLATESDLINATNAANTAAALRASLTARVGPGELLTLRAPRDGIVDALSVQPGDVLASGAVAVRIAAPDALQVRLGVEPEDARRVATGQPVRLAPLNAGATAVLAKISGIDRRVDPQTRLIAALVHLPPHSGLLPGATLRAEIVVAKHPEAITVPRTALLYTEEQAYLFVAASGLAQRREVKIGVQDGDAVEVTDGLRAGELVILAGNSVLDDGMAIRTQTNAAPAQPAAGVRQ